MTRTIIFSLLILLVAGAIAAALLVFRQRPEEREIVPLVTPVEVVRARRYDIPLEIVSQGVIEARTLTNAASEVSGKIIEVAPDFETGGRFEEGDVLLRINPADYEFALAEAKAALARAELNVQVEKAKAEQSLRDWKKLGRSEEPSPLVKREPHLVIAEAELEAAEAAVEKAKRDLERTVLRAPYEGRILRTHTDLASYVGMGSPLADFYDADELEVRLPVSLSDLEFFDLENPEMPVVLSMSTGQSWKAKIVRRESEIDRHSRSLHLVAKIEPEVAVSDALLVPGLFVHARISGETLNDVFRVPRRALHDEKDLLLVTGDDTLIRQPVTVLRKEKDTILVSKGLQEGDRICVSFVPAFQPGMKVEVQEIAE